MDKETISLKAIEEQCPVELALLVLGGKWKPIIVWFIRDKPRRFGELKKKIPKITSKMLTEQLRELEEDGLVIRKVYAQIPPKVEYVLSDYGKTVGPLMESLEKWGEAHKEILKKKL